MAQYKIGISVETEEQLKWLKDAGLAEDSVTLESLKETDGWIGGRTDSLQLFWFTKSSIILENGMTLAIQKEED